MLIICSHTLWLHGALGIPQIEHKSGKRSGLKLSKKSEFEFKRNRCIVELILEKQKKKNTLGCNTVLLLFKRPGKNRHSLPASNAASTGGRTD